MNNNISAFRGIAGEVVAGFIRPSTWLTSIPVFAYWFFVFLALGFLGQKLPELIISALAVAAMSLLIGRFALPASRGFYHAGFFSGELEGGEGLAFAGRFVVIFLIFAVPATGLMWLGSSQLGSGTSAMMMGGMGIMTSVLNAGFGGVLLLIGALVFAFGPTVSIILSTYITDVGGIFTAHPWVWLFVHRRRDLPAFYAAAVGGMIVFFAVYIIPLAIVAALAGAILHEGLAVAIAGWAFVSPYLLAPVILGRLAGAFVAGEADLGGEATTIDLGSYGGPGDRIVPSGVSAAAAQQQLQAPAPGVPGMAQPHAAAPSPINTLITGEPRAQAGPAGAAPAAAAVSFRAVLEAVKACPRDMLAARIVEAEKFRAFDEGALKPRVELVLLYRKAGRDDEAKRVAPEAIELALASKQEELAEQIFKSFLKERFQLKLGPKSYAALGTRFLSAGQFLDGGLCHHAGLLAIGGDTGPAEKKLIEVAEIARNAGKHTEAAALCQVLLAKHPTSTYRDMAQKTLAEAAAKVQK